MQRLPLELCRPDYMLWNSLIIVHIKIPLGIKIGIPYKAAAPVAFFLKVVPN